MNEEEGALGSGNAAEPGREEARYALSEGRTTRRGYEAVRRLSRSLLDQLSPDEAELERWRWNVSRLGSAAYGVRRYLRAADARWRTLERNLNALSTEDRADLWRAVKESERELLERTPVSLATLPPGVVLPIPAAELASYGKSCPPDELQRGVLRAEWDDPELSYAEYSAVVDHYTLCMDCSHDFLLFGWRSMYNAAQRNLGSKETRHILKGAVTSARQQRHVEPPTT